MTFDINTVPETKTSRPSSRYYLLLLPALLYFNAVGITSYVISEWIHDWVKMQMYPEETLNASAPCESVNKSAPDYIMYNEVSSRAAVWMLYNALGSTTPSVIVSAILPSYSDSLGRRFLFLVGTTGYLVKCLSAAVAIHFSLSPIYAIAGAIFEGLCGSYFTLKSAMCSYIADCTKDGKQRTVAMTALDGVELLSTTVSSLAAGYFIGALGYPIPIYTTCAMVLVALLLHTFIIPESHPKPLRSKTFSVFGNLRRTADFYTSDMFKSKRTTYLLLILAYFLTELTSAHRTTMEMIYQLGRPFCWSAEKIGIFSAARHATQGFIAIFLVRPLKKCFLEIHLAVISSVCKIGSYVLEGLARTDLVLYMVPLPASFSYLALSMIKSIMSLMTPSDKQGALFASIYAIYGLCGVIASFLMNGVYAATVSTMSGLVFLVLAAIACADVVVQIIFWTTQRRSEYGEQAVQDVNE